VENALKQDALLVIAKAITTLKEDHPYIDLTPQAKFCNQSEPNQNQLKLVKEIEKVS